MIVLLEAGDDPRRLCGIGLDHLDQGLLGTWPEYVEKVDLGDLLLYRTLVLYDNEYGHIFLGERGRLDPELEAWLEDQASDPEDLRQPGAHPELAVALEAAGRIVPDALAEHLVHEGECLPVLKHLVALADNTKNLVICDPDVGEEPRNLLHAISERLEDGPLTAQLSSARISACSLSGAS